MWHTVKIGNLQKLRRTGHQINFDNYANDKKKIKSIYQNSKICNLDKLSVKFVASSNK